MSILLNILMWYVIFSLACLVVFLGIVAYDRIKYGSFPQPPDEDC